MLEKAAPWTPHAADLCIARGGAPCAAGGCGLESTAHAETCRSRLQVRAAARAEEPRQEKVFTLHTGWCLNPSFLLAQSLLSEVCFVIRL